jgi:hypothetical protein
LDRWGFWGPGSVLPLSVLGRVVQEKGIVMMTSLQTDVRRETCVTSRILRRAVCAASGNLKGGLLGLVVAAAFLGTAPMARAGCGEQNMQNELAEPKALGRAGLKTQFREFVFREFPVGSDGGRLLRWLKRSGFSEPNTTYFPALSVTVEEFGKEKAAANERQRRGSPLQASSRSFNSLLSGQSIYEVYWQLDTSCRIVELYADEVRGRLDLP